jgi:hypothetical protein
MHVFFNGVPGRSRCICHYGPFPLEQGIQQGRLATVGPPHQNDIGAPVNELGRGKSRSQLLQLCQNIIQGQPDFVPAGNSNVFFSEIEVQLQQSCRFGKPVTQCFYVLL